MSIKVKFADFKRFIGDLNFTNFSTNPAEYDALLKSDRLDDSPDVLKQI